MIPNLQPNTTYAVHLRAASSSGGKDWVGSVTAQGEIHTYWGKTGQINQHAGKPGDAQTLNNIISQKKNGKDRYTHRLTSTTRNRDGKVRENRLRLHHNLKHQSRSQHL